MRTIIIALLIIITHNNYKSQHDVSGAGKHTIKKSLIDQSDIFRFELTFVGRYRNDNGITLSRPPD